MTKFIIKDWTGRVLFNGKEFDSFEDGWGFIRETDPMPEGVEDSRWDDYFVEEK